MTSPKKKKNLTREEAAELYKDLRKTMASMKPPKKASSGNNTASAAKEIAQAISQAMAREPEKKEPVIERDPSFSAEPAPVRIRQSTPVGRNAALVLVLVFAMARVGLSALEASGFASVENAQATYAASPLRSASTAGFSREEIKVLTALDTRRQKLEERSKRLEEREVEISRRDREFAAKLTELRELTGKLQTNRVQNERKRDNQLEQLANVYGSMNPNGAAELIEQLDLSIALGLLERMPEKRIGQILGLMSPERALTLTRMLSGRK